MSNPQPARSRLSFSDILAITFFILSVALSLVLFFYTYQKKEVTYRIQPQSIAVFNNDAASPAISVFDQNNKQIKNNIMVTDVVIWNSGTIPIEPEDVREPLRIIMYPTTQILEYKIINQTKPDIAKFSVSEVNVQQNIKSIEQYQNHIAYGDELGGGPTTDFSNQIKALDIHWNHLDPEFAIKIQITYIAVGSTAYQSENEKIQLVGDIIGIKELTNGINPTTKSNALVIDKYIAYSSWLRFVILAIPGILSFLITGMINKYISLTLRISLITNLVVSAALLIPWIIFIIKPVTPPF